MFYLYMNSLDISVDRGVIDRLLSQIGEGGLFHGFEVINDISSALLFSALRHIFGDCGSGVRRRQSGYVIAGRPLPPAPAPRPEALKILGPLWRDGLLAYAWLYRSLAGRTACLRCHAR